MNERVSRSPRWPLLALVVAPLVLIAPALTACSGATDGAQVASADQHGTIAELHQRKCGNCHRLIEPATRPRADIERALERHEKRLHLTRAEWTALADYLAPVTLPGASRTGGAQAKR